MVQIKWTKIARDDLKAVYDYISKDSRRYAKLEIIKIKYRTQILKKRPLAGKTLTEKVDANIRELIEGNYRIIYKLISESQIDILTIHRSARDLENRNIID
jgi:plasmid stabilization system protein ParE